MEARTKTLLKAAALVRRRWSKGDLAEAVRGLGAAMEVFREKVYTVILLYPDYAAEEFGHETFMTSVSANTPEAAVAGARSECVSGFGNDGIGKNDLFVIAVIEGEHDDLNPEG